MWIHLLTTTVVIAFGVTGTLAQDRVLNITTILTDPYLLLRHSDVQLVGNDRYEGFIVDMLEKISTMVGFNYTLHQVTDNRFGSQLQNSTWNGMIGELIRGEADIAAAPLTISPSRVRVVDFTIPFQAFGPVIVFKKPKKPEPDFSIFKERVLRLLTPLGHMVWLTVLIAYLLTGFFLYVVSYCNPYEWRKMAKDGLATYREAESFTCMNTYWFLLSTIVWQGYTRAPRSVGGRVITSFWWMFVVVFLITYIASLTNLLRFSQKEPVLSPVSEIHSFDDLASQTAIRPIALEHGTTAEYVRSSQLPAMERLWALMSGFSDSRVPSLAVGLKKLRTSDKPLAFIMESTFAKVEANRIPCDLMYVGDIRPNRFYAFALGVGSPYQKPVNQAILEMQGTGLLQTIEQKWFMNEGRCGSESPSSWHSDTGNYGGEFTAVDVSSFSGALILLAVGIIAGCLLTAVEYCIFRTAEKEDETEGISDMPVKKESDV